MLSRYQLTNCGIQQLRASDPGFTMIELLVVLALIVILATIGMSQYRNSVIYAREAVLKQDLFRMRDAIDQYYGTRTSIRQRSTRS